MLSQHGLTFDTREEYIDIFIELLVKEAHEVTFSKTALKKYVSKRIEEFNW